MVLGKPGFAQVLGPLPEPAYQALAQGIPVYLWGFPESPGNRALAGMLSGRKREFRALGIRFAEGDKTWVTAREARQMKGRGCQPGENCLLTPLAREILEGSD